MAIDVTIAGNGAFHRHPASIHGYSVTEESTSLDLADQSGGTGQITFTAIENEERSVLLLNDVITLADGTRGTTTGKITGINAQDYKANIAADSRLGGLMVTKQAQPFAGTLEAAFRYYLGLADITDNIFVDAGVPTGEVILQGGEYNLWFLIKELCAVYSVEVSLVSNNIVMRPIRGRIAELAKNQGVGWSVANGELARSININWYTNSYQNNALVYPKGGWTPEVDHAAGDQIDASVETYYDMEVGVSMLSVQQPLAVDYVSRDYTGPISVYSVSGNDNLPITATQWLAQGGEVRVEILEDTRTLRVHMKGASMTEYAPYRIAVSSGASTYYNSLRIMGTGVFYNKQTLNVPTGIDPALTANEVGTEIDARSVSTLSQAHDLGVITAARYALPTQVVSTSTSLVNRKGESGDATYPTFAVFDALYPTQTFGQFDAIWPTQTFAELDAYLFEQVASDFVNQAFGNVAGARFRFRDSFYRIRQAMTTEAQISHTAERDTTYTDFDAVWAGKTFADFDASLTAEKHSETLE